MASRERTILERVALGREGSGPGARPEVGDWRTGPWAFGRPSSKCIRRHERATLLGPQDGQRIGQTAEAAPGGSEAEAARHFWMADTREHANQAFDLFRRTYEAKYPKAVECLTKDRKVLLAFYDFPAEHWIHLRTNQSHRIHVLATVRLRTKRTKGCGSRIACLTMGLQTDAIGIEEDGGSLNGTQVLVRSPPRNDLH